uniref:Uncharacterized protein n=1 Tax=Glossina austeni TaxID=7395 RepID=A0A1A9UFN3_GLOAU
MHVHVHICNVRVKEQNTGNVMFIQIVHAMPYGCLSFQCKRVASMGGRLECKARIHFRAAHYLLLRNRGIQNVVKIFTDYISSTEYGFYKNDLKSGIDFVTEIKTTFISEILHT